MLLLSIGASAGSETTIFTKLRLPNALPYFFTALKIATTLALIGAVRIVEHPGVLAALNPLYAVSFLLSNGLIGFTVLGLVFLTVFLDIAGFSILFPLFPQLLEHYVGAEGADKAFAAAQARIGELIG